MWLMRPAAAFVIVRAVPGRGVRCCHIGAMNKASEDNVLTNYEEVNVYNEQVHKKWR